MSQYGVIYRMEFKNIEGFTIRTDIIPTDIIIGDGDTPVIIPLTAGADPVIISTSNNDRDKYTPIRSKSAEIQFVTNTPLGLNAATFSEGADNLWKVQIYLQDTPQLIFDGFLMLADNQQPFQPDPQYVTLTATDHLAALKEIEWSDNDGNLPAGKYRLADIITQCLNKTGMDKSLFVVNNLRAGSGVLTNSTTFSSGGQYFVTNGLNTKFFYVGQEITISGTASNNGTSIVTEVDNTGAETKVKINVTIVSELVSATFTDTASDKHIYDNIYLEAKTFEKEIGQMEDCYTVLSKILGEDCFLTQWRGIWYIYRVDEMEDNPTYVAAFTSLGVYVSTAIDIIQKLVGANEDIKFANADTLLNFIRPHDFVKETYQYQYPAETPCNNNFSRGDFVSGTNPKLYTIECWTKRRGLPGAYNTPITITAFIEKTYNENDYEVSRLIYITPQTGHAGFSSTDDEYIESEPIQVNARDKFESSINWKFNTNIASSSARLRLFRFILKGDDGSYWILGRPADTGGTDETVQWYNTTGFTTNTARGSTPIVFGTQDETEWQSITWTAPPIPVSGQLYIWLNQAYTNAAVPSTEIISFNNFSFEYIPYINGSYQKFSGQYVKVNRTTPGCFANRDEQVYMSDAPVPLAKGAMFLFNNGSYIICPYYFTFAVYGGPPPNTDYLHPYGYIQVYSVWNQYRGVENPVNGRPVGINIFSGSVVGLTDSWPDLLHKYILTDTNPLTNNRYFLLLSLQQNWKSCIWQATFVEVYNTVIYKRYDDPFELIYINE